MKSNAYFTPQIKHRGRLKQFAGSPVGNGQPGPAIPGVVKE